MSRVDRSIKNIAFGFVQQIVTLILTFVTRTIFIKYLSVELLGVNSLFSNILTVLSMADLGFGTAILYSMYKPLESKDEKKLSALMNYFKKIYLYIAGIIFVVGIILVPFLNFFIKENNIPNIEIYYIMFLLDSVISYLLAYRANIINADQKNYIVKRYTLFFNIIKSVVQCFVVVCFKNFILYLLIQILCTLGINLYGAYISKKMYPFLDSKEKLSSNEKNEIITNVKSLVIYKIGGIILNNTDNILISMLIGITAVGYYTNYVTVINAITAIIAIVFTAVTYSVGNLIAIENKEIQLDIFYKIEFFSNILFSFTSICLTILLNDLISCWLGKAYLIDNMTVICAVANFYILGGLNTTFMFRDTTGMFKKMKYLSMVTALLNIVLSIVLGKIFGLFGIIVATAIARLVTNFWYEPYTMHKVYFNKLPHNYFKSKIFNVVVTIVLSTIIYFITKNFIVTSLTDLIIKTMIVVLLTGIMLFLIYFRNPYFNYYIDIIKNIKLKLTNK